MVGSAIVRALVASGHPTERIVTNTHSELDLTDQAAVASQSLAKEDAISYVIFREWDILGPT